MSENLRVAIADDEPLARQRIEDLLAREEDVEIVASVGSGVEVVDAIRERRPDILFLDVQMPGMSGIDVADAVGAEAMPITIFVTAYERHAVKAFELAAVDYLVKPFDDDRFEEALRRARRAVRLRETPIPEYIDRIPVELRGQLRAVPVAQIDYITASGPYAELHVGGKTYAVRERMQVLEDRLDPQIFLRIHRSAIVRIDFVDAFLRSPGGDYGVRLKSGVELSVSRSRREEIERVLGVG